MENKGLEEEVDLALAMIKELIIVNKFSMITILNIAFNLAINASLQLDLDKKVAIITFDTFRDKYLELSEKERNEKS